MMEEESNYPIDEYADYEYYQQQQQNENEDSNN